MHWRFEKRVRQGDGMEKNAYLKKRLFEIGDSVRCFGYVLLRVGACGK